MKEILPSLIMLISHFQPHCFEAMICCLKHSLCKSERLIIKKTDTFIETVPEGLDDHLFEIEESNDLLILTTKFEIEEWSNLLLKLINEILSKQPYLMRYLNSLAETILSLLSRSVAQVVHLNILSKTLNSFSSCIIFDAAAVTLIHQMLHFLKSDISSEKRKEIEEIYIINFKKLKGKISTPVLNSLCPKILELLELNVKVGNQLKTVVFDLLYDIKVAEKKSIEICKKLICCETSPNLIIHIWKTINAESEIFVRNALLDSWWQLCRGSIDTDYQNTSILLITQLLFIISLPYLASTTKKFVLWIGLKTMRIFIYRMLRF